MNSRRILIADDTEFFRQSFAETFRGEGHEVLLAVDGLDAVQQFRRSADTLDLVVLDLLMPKMTGFDVLREVRKGKLGQDLRVLCITNVFKNAPEIESLQKLGANGFLTKDLSPAEILERIRRTLAEPREAGPGGRPVMEKSGDASP